MIASFRVADNDPHALPGDGARLYKRFLAANLDHQLSERPLDEEGGYALERKMRETARVALEVNLAREVGRLPVASSARELRMLVA